MPGIFDATLFRQSLAAVAGVPVLSIGGFGMSSFQAAAKRSLDIIGFSTLAACPRSCARHCRPGGQAVVARPCPV